MSHTSRLKASRLRVASLAAAALVLGASAGAGLSCTLVNQDHCFFADGKCGAGLVCDSCSSVNNGCVEQVSSESCRVTAGATMSATDTTTTDATTTDDPTTTTTLEPTTSSTTDTTTDGTETATDPTEQPFACEPGPAGHALCAGIDSTKPYCWAKDTCGACGDFDGFTCIDATSGAAPACESNSGLCVQCTPEFFEACLFPAACDADTFTCGPCTEHSQCETGACNLATGKCVPEQWTFWAENRPGCHTNEMKPGTKEEPWCTYHYSLMTLENYLADEIAVFIRPGTMPQPSLFQDVTWARTVILIGVTEEGEEPPVLKHTIENETRPILYVDPSIEMDPRPSRLMIANLELLDATNADAINCVGAEVWVDDSRITNNRVPLTALDCKYQIRRSVFTGHRSTPNLIESDITIENSYFTGNKVDADYVFRLVDTQMQLVYSTFVGNTNQENLPVLAVRCGNLASTLSVRNSVILGAEGYIYCGMGGAFGDDGGNFFGPPEIVNNLFNMPVKGVYRPKLIADLKDTATWQPGDPYRDFDGDKRPATAGAVDFSGADRP
jgi:hypothetical protein